MPGPVTSSTSEPPRIGFVTWADDRPTGGNHYNRGLIDALRRAGCTVQLRRVAGPWPGGSDRSRRDLALALLAEPFTVVDGIVASTSADAVRSAVAAGRRVAVLIHMPVADEVGLPPTTRDAYARAEVARAYARAEAATVLAASAVLTPSRAAADDLIRRYGRADIVIAPPGIPAAPLAAGSDPPHLLCLGAVTPTKDQESVLAALATMTDLAWTAAVVGSLDTDRRYAARVRAGAASLGRRVAVTGVLVGAQLDRQWAATDLLIHAARTETYGLAVAEALARGIPAVVRAGTGAPEALGAAPDGSVPGRVVDPEQLAATLREWLTTPELRDSWIRAARLRRPTLPTWEPTVGSVLRVLRSGEPPS